MADIITPQKKGRRKVQSTRIDFTPMVDLGFILITFFIYTTTIARPGAMEIKMPSNDSMGHRTVFAEESTITLLPVKGHKVAWYYGTLKSNDQLKTQSVDEVNDCLFKMKKRVAALPFSLSPDAHKLHVLIKPNDDCSYEDVVHLLDDMSIVGVTFYALVDITPEEKQMVNAMK